MVNLEAEMQRARQESVELLPQVLQYKVQTAENAEKVSWFTELEEKVIALRDADERSE